jgi:hypothetical protein
MFWKKKKVAERTNVGKATLQITFTDNSSEVIQITGTTATPAKYIAREFMHTLPRHDYRVVNDDGNRMTFKDIRCVYITALEPYWIE